MKGRAVLKKKERGTEYTETIVLLAVVKAAGSRLPVRAKAVEGKEEERAVEGKERAKARGVQIIL
jgi:hypothetical protein